MSSRYLIRSAVAVICLVSLVLPSVVSAQNSAALSDKPSADGGLMGEMSAQALNRLTAGNNAFTAYENGNQQVVTAVNKEGKASGLSQFLDIDGTVICERQYANDLLMKDGKPFTGSDECRDAAGNLRSRIQHKEGLQDGLMEIWMPNNVPLGQWSYRKGKLDGVSKWYDEKGHLLTEAAYQDDKLNGTLVAYYPDGAVRTKADYVNGEAKGKLTSYYSSGALQSEGEYGKGKFAAKMYFPENIVRIEISGTDEDIVPDYKIFDQSGQPLKSIEEYNEVIKAEPDNSDNFFKRAIRYWFNRANSDALVDLTLALQKDPENHAALYSRARMYYEKYDYSNAIKDLEKINGKLSKDWEVAKLLAEAHYFRGWDAYEQKHYDQALEDYQWLIVNAPDYEDLYKVYNNRGIIYADKKEYEKAIEDYNRTIVINHYYKAYMNRAMANEDLGRIAEAIADYERAIVIKSDYVGSYHNLGRLYYKQKQYDKALALYDKLLTLDRGYVLGYISRANVYMEQKDFARAKQELEVAMALSPKDYNIHYNLGNLLRDTGEFEQALGSYEKAIAIDPNNGDAYVNRGTTYERMGRMDEAFASYQKAVEVEPEDSAGYTNLAFHLMLKNDMDAAKTAIDKAMTLDPKSTHAYDKLGMWHMLNGNNKGQDAAEYQLSVEAFTRAIELDAAAPETYNNRASVYLNLRQYDKAWADVDKVKALGGTPNEVMLGMLQRQSPR